MVDNRIDLCRHYPVLLVDYHIGEIKYDENEKPVSRENTMQFMIDRHIDDWENIMLSMNAIFNNSDRQISFPDEYLKYHQGRVVITNKWHERGSYFFEVTQYAEALKYDRYETMQTTVDNSLRLDRDGFFEINNMGTAPCRFKFYNESMGENGYLGIVMDDQYYSIGDAEEADKIPIPENKLVIDEEMDNLNAWTHNDVQPPNADCHATGGFKETKYGSTVSDIIPNPIAGKTWYGPSAIRRFYTDELNEDFASSFHAKFRLAAQSSNPHRHTFRTVIGILDQNKEFMFWLDMRDGSSRYANNHMRIYNTAGGTTNLVTQNDGRINNFAGNFQIQKDGNRVTYRLYHVPDAGYGYLKDNASGGWSIDRAINQPQFDAAGRVASYIFVWAGRPLDEEVYDHLELTQTRVLKKYWDGDGNVTNILAPGNIFYLNTSSGRAYTLEDFRDANDTAGQGATPINEKVNPGSDVALELHPGINHLFVDRSSWYNRNDPVTIVFRQRYY